jgi:hypothetical protein
MQAESPQKHTNITVAGSGPHSLPRLVAVAVQACCHFAAKIVNGEVNHAILPQIKFIFVAFKQQQRVEVAQALARVESPQAVARALHNQVEKTLG